MSSLRYEYVTEDNLYDCVRVLENLRQEDIDEIESLYGVLEKVKGETLVVIINSLSSLTNVAYILYQNKVPVAIFGNDLGIVWLLATPKLKASVSYFKIAKHFLEAWKPACVMGQWNIASTSNTKTLKWLERIGFELEDLGNGMTKFEYK